MKNKKFIFLLVAVIMIGFLFNIPAFAEETSVDDISAIREKFKGTELVVFNWGEYISDGSDDSLDVNKRFEELYGIKVIYDNYATNEDLYGKLKTGGANYDVIIPSDYMIQRMISEEMLEKLDFSNIPNYANIDFEYKDLYFDGKNEYSVPYNAGMVGIIYNTEMTGDDVIDSWASMWDEKYKGNILQFDNPRDAFSTAQFLLGIDVNTNNKDDWEKAADKLIEQKPLLQGYVMDEIFNKMNAGKAAVAAYYAGDFFTMYENNDKLSFVYPKEGTNIFVDSMCVPKGAKNKEAAELYINFMLSEEIAIANAEFICYTSPNKLVRQNDDYIEYLGELHEDAYALLYPEEGKYKTEYFHNLDQGTLNLINDLWDNVKAAGGFDWILYTVCGLILVVLVVIIVNRSIQKKKRESDD